MKELEGRTGVINGVWFGGWKTQVTTHKYLTCSDKVPVAPNFLL